MTCEICGKEEALPFICHYCGKEHCGRHKLPENHNCGVKWIRIPGRLFSGDIYK